MAKLYRKKGAKGGIKAKTKSGRKAVKVRKRGKARMSRRPKG